MSLRNSSSARAVEKEKDRRRQVEREIKVNSKEISQDQARASKETKRKSRRLTDDDGCTRSDLSDLFVFLHDLLDPCRRELRVFRVIIDCKRGFTYCTISTSVETVSSRVDDSTSPLIEWPFSPSS